MPPRMGKPAGRTTKKHNEEETTKARGNQKRKHGDIMDFSHSDSTTNLNNQACQSPEGSPMESPSKYLKQVVYPSTFEPEMTNEETEKVGNSIAQENFRVDIPEIMEEGGAEKSLDARKTFERCGMLKEEKESTRKRIEDAESKLKECEERKREVEAMFRAICDEETVCKETLAKAMDESSRMNETIKDAIAKVKRFLHCSLVDYLL